MPRRSMAASVDPPLGDADADTAFGASLSALISGAGSVNQFAQQHDVQANQFAQPEPSSGVTEDDDDDDDNDDDDEEEDFAQFIPSDAGSQDDEEWRLSEASDVDSDPGPEGDHHIHVAPPQAATFPTFASATSASSRLTKAQRQAMAVEAMGPEAWRGLASQRRQQHRTQDGADEHEVEEEELNRLMAGLRDDDDDDDANASTSSPRPPSVAALSAQDEFRDEIMKSSGFKKQRRGKKKTRRALPEQLLSHEVRGLLRDANILYVEGHYQQALEKLQEVIRIEPTIRTAWSTLAMCMADLGFVEKELQARIIEATLTPRATELWITAAQRSFDAGLTRQAIYCFEQAIRTSTEKDKSDVIDVMWDRACVLRDIGDPKATEAFSQLLRLRPHSAEVLGELIPLFLARGQTLRAVKALEQCRDFNVVHFANPTASDVAPLITYRSSEIVTLADLLLLSQEPLSALHTVRQGARWLQGRASETFWDQIVEDDREFDDSRESDVRPGAGYGRRVEMAPVYGTLDVQLRLRLGYARAKIGDIAEAHRHFEAYLTGTQPAEHSEQYEELADIEMDINEHERALDVLERMAEEDFMRVPALYAKIGICHQNLGNLEDAIRCFEPVVEAEPHNLDMKIRLAEAYEDTDRRHEAIRLVNEVMQAREEQARARGLEELPSEQATASTPTSVRAALNLFNEQQAVPSTSGGSSSTSRRKRNTMDAKQRKRLEQAREEETRLMFQRLQARESAVFFHGWWRSDVTMQDNAEERRARYGIHAVDVSSSDASAWLDAASRLVDSFLGISQLFPRKRGGRSQHHQPAQQTDITWSRRRRLAAVRRDAGKPTTVSRDTLGNQAAELLSRIQDDIVNEGAREHESGGSGQSAASQHWLESTSFRGVDFEDWVDLFMKYALVQTKMGNYRSAIDALSQFRSSFAVLHNQSRQMAVALCSASCALYARNHEGVFEALRTLPFAWQFNNTPLRVLASIGHACGFYGLDWFSEARLAKMILRRMRIHEAIAAGRPFEFSQTQDRYVVKGPMRTGFGRGGRAGSERSQFDDDGNDDEDDEEEGDGDGATSRGGTPLSSVASRIRNEGSNTPSVRSNSPGASIGSEKPPSVGNPMGELFYSYYLLAAGSYQAALAYSLRAYSRNPHDPLICLVVSIACFGRMTNRQTDNRHHLFMQGMSFLSRYKSLKSDGRSGGEAAYNFGRALHSLGLLSMAVDQYQSVLESEYSPAVCHREAAWNLSLISSINGDSRGARMLLGKYLVVE